MNSSILSLLYKEGQLSKANLETLNLFMQKRQVSEYNAILDTNIITEAELANALATLCKIERIYEIDKEEVNTEVFKLVPYGIAKRYCCFPLESAEGKLKLMIADPSRQKFIEALEKLLNCEVELAIGERKSIDRAIDRFYPVEMQILSFRNQTEFDKLKLLNSY